MRTDTASNQAVVPIRQHANQRQKLKQLLTTSKMRMQKNLARPQHIPLAQRLHNRIISLASKRMIRAHPIRRTIAHNRVRPRTRTPAFPFRKLRPTPRRRPALVSKPAGHLFAITRRLTLNRIHTRKPSRHNKHTSKPNTPNPDRPSRQHPLPQSKHTPRTRPIQVRSHAASPPIYPTHQTPTPIQCDSQHQPTNTTPPTPSSITKTILLSSDSSPIPQSAPQHSPAFPHTPPDQGKPRTPHNIHTRPRFSTTTASHTGSFTTNR